MEKKCKYCAMMIPKEAKVCPHCRKKQGTSGLVWVLVILFFFFMIIAMITSVNSPTGGKTSTASSGKDFFFKCLDAYSDDAQICVKGELTRNSFDTVESWLKQYVAEHPGVGKKKKK